MDSSDGILKIGSRNVAVKRLDKLYSKSDGILKAEVLDFYIKNSPLLLPHIKNKPFSMIHFPEGVGGKSFYQKQCPVGAPSWLKTVTLPSSAKGSLDWCLVNDAASVAYMANRSVIEMHTWFSRLPNLDIPDVAVIDLDPSGGTGFREAQTVARTFRELLHENNIFAVPKTTGKRGIHIYIPVKNMSFADVQAFLNKLCIPVLARHPNLATQERTVKKRGDKIYLDVVQNAGGKTIAAPYSLRAGEKLPVSTPLLWEELDDKKILPSDFNIRNFDARLQKVGDLFDGFYQKRKRCEFK